MGLSEGFQSRFSLFRKVPGEHLVSTVKGFGLT